MTETNKMLEECANYLLNHCFVLGGVEDQRAKYLYVQDHLNEVRAVFAPLGYSVVLYPAQHKAVVEQIICALFQHFIRFGHLRRPPCGVSE